VGRQDRVSIAKAAQFSYVRYRTTSSYPWTIHHATTWLGFPKSCNFSRDFVAHSVALQPHWSSLRLLYYLQNTGQININWRNWLKASLWHDVLKADTNLHKLLKLVAHQQTWPVFPCWEKHATFLQILQSGLFCFKTKLPGKYRNGVVLAFSDLAISMLGGEQLIHRVLYMILLQFFATCVWGFSLVTENNILFY